MNRLHSYALLGAILVIASLGLGVAMPEQPLAPGLPEQLPQLAGTSIGELIKGPAGNTEAHYLNVSDSEVIKYLDDPANRVGEEFRLPRGTKDLVAFWLLIYTKYSFYHTLIYDRDHHEAVYEVVDNRDLFNKGLGPVALEIQIKKRVKRTLEQYRAAFQKLKKSPKAHFAKGTAGANVLRVWGPQSAKNWRHIAENIRSQAGQRDRVMQGLSSADRFLPPMEAIFRKFKIPTEITRVPLVESSFNIGAESKADAVGVWQFLERSATEYLVVDKFNHIDERRSPIKATYAAAKMFRRNYKLLRDWDLAVIAYNHGVKSLRPVRNKYRGERIAKLLLDTKSSPLGYASRNYFAEFLAMLHAERYRDVFYGMRFQNYADSISIVKMKRPGSVFDLASFYNISIHELRIYNPDIFDLKRKLPAGTRIVVPKKLGESLVSAPVIAPAVDATGSEKPAGRGIASDIEILDYLK